MSPAQSPTDTARRDDITAVLAEAASGRVLDPVDRVSEVLFGLFMVLTFTGTLSVLDSGREEVRNMLVAAIGCNIAWGFVDGMMYVLRNLVARGRSARLMRAVRSAGDPALAHRLIRQQIGALAASLGTADIERVRSWIVDRPEAADPAPRVSALDLRGALGIFLLVFLSTFPVVLPFVFIADPAVAKRVSAGVAIGMLFVCGAAWGRYAGLRPVRVGLFLVVLGLFIEAIVIALGG